MKQLIVHPTATSQWYALINDAQVRRRLQLDEELESYLVFLLMRFTEQPEIADSILALDFLQSQHEVGQAQQELLRDVGDKCLLFSGLFPGLAKRRRVDSDYFVTLGQSAYATLSQMEVKKTAVLFSGLCQEFICLKDILQAIRDLPRVDIANDSNEHVLTIEMLRKLN